MDTIARTRLTVVWLALSGITLVSWWIGSLHGHVPTGPNGGVTVGVIAIAAVKIRLIVSDFMEARHAPAWLQRVNDAWIAALCLALLGVYFVQTGSRL